MSRPLRIQLPGAIYHVTSRGNRRAPIFHDHRDHLIWLDILAETAVEHGFQIYGYCLMPNHYHLVIRTTEANLSEGMQQLNATYCQHHNHRHKLTGHVLQGRFHAVLIEGDKQLLATTRYISLNPQRAKLVSDPADWPWSSHRHFLGPASAPEWLETEWLLAQFAGEDLPQRIAAYKDFVNAGIGLQNPIQPPQREKRYVHELPPPLATFAARFPNRDEAMARAHQSGAYTRDDIASHFGVSKRTVTRAIQRLQSPCPVGPDPMG